ncbi:MAG: hypothetical protein ABWX84_04480 [Nocardioides sp.]
MLAEARHDGPVPPEVAARLDDVLAGLRAQTPDTQTPDSDTPDTAADRHERPATVVPLRRRLHRLPRYVLAAAAVVAIGYGTTQVIGNTLGGTASDSSAGGDSTAEDSGVDRDAGSGEAPSSAEGAPPPTAFGPLDELGVEGLEPISPVTLDKDLNALDSTVDKQAARSSVRRLAEVCGPRTPVPGSRTLPAAYDGRPTLVVYLPPEGGSQRVELYLCDTEKPRQPFRSVTLATGE